MTAENSSTPRRALAPLDDDTTGNARYGFADFGDADLNGKVNTVDFNALAGNFGASSGKVWAQGDFNYDDAFHVPSREAYETLLLEIIEGSTTLFMRADQERAAWEIVEPVLEVWRESPSMSMPNYAAGTWGPVSADMLLVRNARSWYNPMPVIAADSVRGEEC